MKYVPIYEAVSRVVDENNNIIGLMVRPYGKKKQEIFMSLDTLCFGLSEKTFEVKDVKLSNSGKPRGCNGFLLSKLPIVSLDDENDVKKKIGRVMRELCRVLEVPFSNVVYSRVGITEKCSITVELEDYVDMPMELANEELKHLLKYYHKVVLKPFRKYYDKVDGNVDKAGKTTIVVIQSLVKEDKV